MAECAGDARSAGIAIPPQRDLIDLPSGKPATIPPII
jgi:hypothetical protein